jgi:hypothetical protein
MNEIVYVLINEAMPGYVKIGFTTTSIEQRIRELDTTAIPLPFECYFAAKLRTRSAKEIERLLHDAFLEKRVRSSREFFQISPERVVSALRIAEIEDITPNRDFVESEEDQKALDKARERRVMFNFEMAKIPLGATLVFVEDENITATVVKLSGQKTIEYQGEISSPSSLAQRIKNNPYPLQGTLYWMYEGETLDERRRRIELGEE